MGSARPEAEREDHPLTQGGVGRAEAALLQEVGRVVDEAAGFQQRHRMRDLFGRVHSECVSLCDAMRSPLLSRVSVGVVVEDGFVPDLQTEHSKWREFARWRSSP